MKIPVATLLIVASAVTARAEPPASSRMKNFDLQHCSQGSCYNAKGETGFVSIDGATLAAAAVRLELRIAGQRTEQLTCASFRYDLRTDGIICDNRGDNREAPQLGSLTIDGTFNVLRFQHR